MRGLWSTIIGIFFLLLTIILTLFFLLGGFNPVKADTTLPPPYLSQHPIDYKEYLLSENPIVLSSYNNCEKLKYAVKYAVMTGRSFKVDEIEYGSDLFSKIDFPPIGNCPNEELVTKITSSLNQTVCNFKRILTNDYDIHSTQFPFDGVSDGAGLSFDNCVYFISDYASLFSDRIGPESEDLEHSSDDVDLFYSPDYLYIENGDFSHSPTLFNLGAFYNSYNGPGRMLIYVGNASVRYGDCVFNIYFCPRPAIAKTIENRTINIFNIFKDLEIDFDERFLPYYILDLSDKASDMTSYSKKVYYWNYYDVRLDSGYKVETILNAIKEGFYLNVFGKNYFFAHPHWDIQKNTGITKTYDCWSPEFDSIINGGDTFSRTRSIRFNCGSDDICDGELRIKIAIRVDDKTENIDGEDVDLNYVSGFISFCDSPQICGNDIKEIPEECDGTDLGIPPQTCVGLGYDTGTLGCIAAGQPNECKFDTSDCVNYVCGNDILEPGEQCDTTKLGGETCESRGFTDGTLGCTAACTFDTSGCTGPSPQVCGNNVKEGTEECDGSDLGGQTCVSKGFISGTLGCIAAGQPNECKFDTSSCVNYVCGNNVKEGTEECDGSDLGGQTCVSKGFISGTLGCTASCTFDTSGCCSCSSPWVSGGCGGGTCNSWEILFTRTCTPAGCDIEEDCSDADSCCDTACGSWTNGSCLGADEPGCICSGGIGARWRTRTCPAGATICVKKECLYTGACPDC